VIFLKISNIHFNLVSPQEGDMRIDYCDGRCLWAD